jgi:hypothetical protein
MSGPYIARERPGTVTTAAVLNFVFGGIFAVCCGLNGLVSSAFSASMFQQGGTSTAAEDLQNEMAKEAPTAKAIGIGDAALDVVLGIAMILLGVGLLKMQAWARTGTIVIWLVTIGIAVAVTIYNMVVIAPAFDRALKTVTDRHPNDPGLKMFQSGLLGALIGSGGLIRVVIECAMALPMIILMMVRSTRDAFSGHGPVLPPPPDAGWGGSPGAQGFDEERFDNRGDEGIRT